MLGIRLREHHELGIGGVSIQPRVTLHQVVNFLGRESQAEVRIGLYEGLATTARKIDGRQRRRLVRFKKCDCFVATIKQNFGHSIEQHTTQRSEIVVADVAFELDAVTDTALDALNHIEVARQRNIRCFARPR